MKKIEIGELKEGCADNCGLIDLNAIRFPNEIASVRFCADFKITEQEENDVLTGGYWVRAKALNCGRVII